MSEVLEDAIRLAAQGEWNYIGTLSYDATLSARIEAEMSKLAQAVEACE